MYYYIITYRNCVNVSGDQLTCSHTHINFLNLNHEEDKEELALGGKKTSELLLNLILNSISYQLDKLPKLQDLKATFKIT